MRLKRLILKIINKLGYSIQPKNTPTDFNINLYNDYYPKEDLLFKKFYNVGAGNFYHPYWTNVDFYSKFYDGYNKNENIHINYNLMDLKPLPLETECSNVFYTSHTIEHITNDAAQNFFNEAFRTLKKGGTFRIIAPDIDLHYHAFVNNDMDFFYFREWYHEGIKLSEYMLSKPLTQANISELFLYQISSILSPVHSDNTVKKLDEKNVKEVFESKSYSDALDYLTDLCPRDKITEYPFNHINWWNFEKLKTMLKIAGFNEIYFSGYGQSRLPILRNTQLFDNTHPKLSLYMEGIK